MKKFYYFFGEGSVVNQVICAVLINLPVFAYGASIGWMSPMTLLLQSKSSPRSPPLTDFEMHIPLTAFLMFILHSNAGACQVSWMAASSYLVCIPADFLMAYLSDKIGRKITLILISASCVGCWVIKLTSLETWAFITARSFVGLSMAGCYVTCPLYTKEISQDHIRGLLGSLVVLFQTSGNLFTYIIGDYLSYNTVLWICMTIPTFHLVLFMMMPESPSFLVKRGQIEEARRVLAWLRCRDEEDLVIKNELESLRKEQKKDEESSKFVIKAIVTDKILFRAFRISMVVTIAREVCGAIPVLNFAGNIFEMASEGSGLVLTPNQQAMMLGAVQVAGAMVASSIVEKTGRKPLLFTTSLVSGLSMCALASWFLARRYELYTPEWVPVFTLCLCIFCDASGLQPLSVIILGEIFSFKYRGTVMAIAMASSSFFDFFQMLFFKPLANAVGVYVAFYFFGGVCLLAALYVLLVIPETKNKSLTEIYHALKTKKEKESEEKTSIEDCIDEKQI